MERHEPSAPYLVMRADYSAKPVRRRWRVRISPKTIAAVMIAGGVACGSYLVTHAVRGSHEADPAPVVAKVDGERVARLQDRNRRLEALVWTLRQRQKSGSATRK